LPEDRTMNQRSRSLSNKRYRQSNSHQSIATAKLHTFASSQH